MVLSKHSFGGPKSRFSGEAKNLFCYKLFLKSGISCEVKPRHFGKAWCSSISVNHKRFINFPLMSLMGINFGVNQDWWFIHRALYPAKPSFNPFFEVKRNLSLLLLLRHVNIYHIRKLMHYAKLRLTKFCTMQFKLLLVISQPFKYFIFCILYLLHLYPGFCRYTEGATWKILDLLTETLLI